MKEKLRLLLARPVLRDYRLLLGLWLLLAVIAALMKMHSHNNFLIFRGTFWHAWQGVSLYAEYPLEHWDTNHYGPLFALLFAPFAVVPEWLGLLMWCVALTLLLYIAVRRSLFTDRQQVFVLWFCAHELLTALYMQQFNIAIAAILLLSFFLIEQERDAEAAFFIVVGTLVKLYGVVGLAFFLFSRHKLKLVLSLVGWGVILFAVPMVLGGPDYIVSQYAEWYHSLVGKNDANLFAPHQNISLLGMVRKISGSAAYSDLTAMPKEFKNRWVVPGDENVTDIPVIASRRQYYANNYIGRAYNAYNYSTARVASGSFIRMKEISLTYDLPTSFIKHLRLNSASLKVAATNLFLLYSDSKLNGQDPEYVNSGGVASPNPKQITFTVRFGL